MLDGIVNQARVHIHRVVDRKLVFGLDEKIKHRNENYREKEQEDECRPGFLEKVN
jgi:coenzyme F420-reducing hydrogenase beta subunit